MGDLISTILAFMSKGGDVLWLIAILVFFMWTLIIERLFTFWLVVESRSRSRRRCLGRQRRTAVLERQANSREAVVAESRFDQRQYGADRYLRSAMPLLGLLGTVTGMIEVFNVMAVTGGGDAKSMAGGVERSTIPTMAGMVAALSGLFANTQLQSIALREQQLLEDQLTSDH